MSVLERIVERTLADVRERRGRVPLAELEREMAGRSEDRPFSEALTLPGISVIAEHKRRSPSAGVIREGATVEQVVCAYERGGAAALSILTDEPHFGGSLDDLRAAREASALPILRKDFIVDPYQLYESAAAGADAVLLIVAALDPDDLARLYAEARGIDLDVLVEVHCEAELACALEVVDADVIGINNRDLSDFSVDVGRTLRAPQRRARRKDGGLRVRPARPRAARRARAGGSRRRAHRRDPDARARPGGGGPRSRGPGSLTSLSLTAHIRVDDKLTDRRRAARLFRCHVPIDLVAAAGRRAFRDPRPRQDVAVTLLHDRNALLALALERLGVYRETLEEALADARRAPDKGLSPNIRAPLPRREPAFMRIGQTPAA